MASIRFDPKAASPIPVLSIRGGAMWQAHALRAPLPLGLGIVPKPTKRRGRQQEGTDAAPAAKTARRSSGAAAAAGRSYRCQVPGCEKTYTVRDSLKRHMRTEHTQAEREAVAASAAAATAAGAAEGPGR